MISATGRNMAKIVIGGAALNHALCFETVPY